MLFETQKAGGLYLELTNSCERPHFSFYVQHRFAKGLCLELKSTFAEGLYPARRNPEHRRAEAPGPEVVR